MGLAFTVLHSRALPFRTKHHRLSSPLQMTSASKHKKNAADIRTSVYNRSHLNRLNNERRRDVFIQSNTTSDSKFLIFSHSLQVLTLVSPSASLALMPPEHVPPFDPNAVDPPLLVLGKDDDQVPFLAIRLPQQYNPATWLATLPRESGTPKFLHLRSAARTFEQRHAAMAAHARALFEFHTRHTFCGMCGANTVPEQGGSRRRCERNVQAVEPPPAGVSDGPTERTGCVGMWFPRTDPVAIMLVVDKSGERVLLGRQKRYTGGMFSCLAGFMEHGEGVDDAVRREVFEESGVIVDRVRFFGSQAWPFPYSLMLGCIAEAAFDQITVDEHELETAQWFTRDEIKEMTSRAEPALSTRSEETIGYSVPPRSSIAGQMLAAYAAGEDITSFKPQHAPSML